MSAREHIISDMTIARPATALATFPEPDKWLVLPYEGPEISGKMIWAPSRSMPEDVTIPLPALGRCRIHVGIYSSGTVPYWFNLALPKGSWNPEQWHRLHVRLSDEDYDTTLTPVTYPNVPRFTHICERYWKTADLQGQSLVVRGRRQDALMDAMSFIAFIRLVQVDDAEAEPAAAPDPTKYRYVDGNMFGHNVSTVQEVKNIVLPARDKGCSAVFWNASRDDTCYYNTRVGLVLPDHGVPGTYPHYAGRDIHRMIDAGLDPLAVVCDVAHEAGMEVFASLRRMSYRMPPFTYPMHPDALMVRRRDLCCVDPQGGRLPHLSLAYPEVRARYVAIQTEQVRDYDTDGVHLFLTRGVPFVGYEAPFLDAFEAAYPGVDPRHLPLEDERPWEIRGRFVTQYLRELRAACAGVAAARGRMPKIAVHVMHCVRVCRYYGLDIPVLIREGLVDILIPARSCFMPPEMGEWPECRDTLVLMPQIETGAAMAYGKPEHLAEFEALAAGTPVQIYGQTATEIPYAPRQETGHRMVQVDTIDGLTLDHISGIPTCG